MMDNQFETAMEQTQQNGEEQVSERLDQECAKEEHDRNIDAQREHKRSKKQPQKPEPQVRRVGTFTLGIALMLTGILIAMSFILPDFNLIGVMKLAPLVLVALGIEVLWANMRKGQARLKYDFLSGFVCLVLVCCSMGAALIPTLWKYYGPERSMQNAQIERQLQQKLFDEIPKGLVENCELLIDWSGIDEPALKDIHRAQYARANIDLSGPFETPEEFATACSQVLPILRENGLTSIFFSSQSSEKRWEMAVTGMFRLNASEEQLVNQVDCYLPYDNEGSVEWMTEEDIRRTEEQKQQYQKQAIKEAIYEGYSYGFEDGVSGAETQKSYDEVMKMAERD